MCGIAGFNFEDSELLNNMLNKLNHRGPDDRGKHIEKGVSIGNTRLSIIDLENGKQPIYNEDKSIVIVFNGEIFNYKEIKEKLLLKHKFTTNSDTEVLVHAYEEYGLDFIKLLEGQFAFAIWDSNKNKILLVRDHVGITPLYYYFKGNTFIFASEAKVILEHIKPEVNESIIGQYLLNGFTDNSQSFFKDIKKLLPSHYMIFKDNNLTINKYESIIVPKEKRRINDKYIYSIVSREIEKATIADVPVGVYLSGGIDSSVITASLYNKGFEDINTFSVGFEDKNVVNELPFAREIANKFNTNHHEVSFTSEDCIKYFDDIVYTLDEPVADTTIFPVYFLSKLASKNVKVVLSGVGGDEVFAGYPQYRFVYYWSNYIKKFGLQKPTSYLLTNFILRNKSDKAKELFSNIKSQNNYEDVFKTVMNRLYSDEELKKLVYNYNSKDLLSSDSFNNKLDYMQYYDLVGNVQNNYLIFSDKINLLNGVEGRVPLLNKNIINLGFSLKDNQRLNYNSGKLALKKAYKDYLPKSILTRKKYGFTSPLKSWFETGFYNELENLSQNNEITKYFDKAELDKLILSKDYNKLWRLLIFMKWHKVYFD